MIGRKEEIRRLRQAYESSYSEFVSIYGRRRIGKTFLVNEVFGYKFAFHVAGLKKEGLRRQLDNFQLALKRQGHADCPRLKSWLEAFYELEVYLERLPAEGRKVVFIDEMPWMDTHKSGFLSALEGFWNGWATSRKDILLVACGSATSWIVRKLNRNRGGLHNRLRTQIRLEPFTLAECEEYARELGLGYDRHHVLECYMVFGGVAYYWSLLEKGRSPEQNIDLLFFGRREELRAEFDELYSSLFTNPEPYVRIIAVLGRHRQGLGRDEIAKAVGCASSGGFTAQLEDLEECGFVRKYLPVGGENSGVYQLADSFSLFYMTFVEGNSSRDGEFWSAEVNEGRKNDWRGNAFERVCIAHVPQMKKALGISGVHADVYSWKATASGDVRGAQVDLLIDRRDGIANLCEMKYSVNEFVIDKQEDANIANRVAAFRKVVGPRRTIHVTIVTANGLKHNIYWNNVHSEICLDDLFAG